MQKVNSLNGCSRPGITAAIVALFLLLIAGRAPLIARPFYVQLFENSIKESNQGNTAVAAELALEALQLCPPGSSRARIRLHLAEVYIKEEKFAASRCQYELLAKEGQTWIPASIYGVANTSGLLGDEKRLKESVDAFIADFSDHPLRSQLEFIKLNPQSEIAFKEQQTSKDEVTEVVIPDISSGQAASYVAAIASAPTEKKEPDSHFIVSVEAWLMTPKGNAISRGMDLDLTSNADFGSQSILNARLGYRFDKKLQLQFNWWNMSASSNIRQIVNYDGLAYAPGASARFEVRSYESWLKRVVGENAKGVWSAILGASFPEVELRLAQNMLAGRREGKLDQDYSLPVLGFMYEGSGSGLQPFLEARMMRGLSGDHARLHDLKLAMTMSGDSKAEKRPLLSGILGYRWWGLSSSINNDEFKLNFSGPFLGVNLDF